VGILVRFARFNETHGHVVGMCPSQHGVPTELLTVVGADHLGRAAGSGEIVDDAGDGETADHSLRHDGHRFVCGGIDDLDHPARLYLIDGRGQIREIYSLAFFDETQAFADIAALLQERKAFTKR
jgi:hypothetical protein